MGRRGKASRAKAAHRERTAKVRTAAGARHLKALARARAARERRIKGHRARRARAHRARRERMIKAGKNKERRLKRRISTKTRRVGGRYCAKWSKIATSLVQVGHHRVTPVARRCLRWKYGKKPAFKRATYKWVTHRFCRRWG